jgi:hypothetical protein
MTKPKPEPTFVLRTATTEECQEDVLLKIVREMGGSVLMFEEMSKSKVIR